MDSVENRRVLIMRAHFSHIVHNLVMEKFELCETLKNGNAVTLEWGLLRLVPKIIGEVM